MNQTETMQKRLRTLQGEVVGDQRHKTIAVLVKTQKKHPTYKKIMVRSKKYHVHDEQNIGKIGDMVEIAECRPISKTKTWRLLKVVRAAS